MKSFRDTLFLAMLNEKPEYGYTLMEDIYAEFGVLLSPGRLYPLLYLLKNENLITVEEVENRKVYRLTPRGQKQVEQLIKDYRKETEKIMRFKETRIG